jgi:hypothetical protein
MQPNAKTKILPELSHGISLSLCQAQNQTATRIRQPPQTLVRIYALGGSEQEPEIGEFWIAQAFGIAVILLF